MGKKIRLNKVQKLRHENLVWYLKNKCLFVGTQNLKEAVLDGKYAVLSVRGEHSENVFECVICCDKEDIDSQVKYNCSTRTRVLNLDSLMEVMEVTKSWAPDLTNWIEKTNQTKKTGLVPPVLVH